MAAVVPQEFPAPRNGRVALVGDTHANTWWTTRVIESLAADGVRVMVQLGDFGWWPHMQFARKVSWAAARAKVEVLFIDGNHEHHPGLRASALQADPGGSPGRPVLMHPNLWYLPRGCAWEWDGVQFRALGGAYSIDMDARVAGKNWFPEEAPSFEDAHRAIRAGPADVLLSHDYPEVGYQLPSMPGLDEKHEKASRAVQSLLAEVVEAIEPELVVHGHWHRRYSIERGGVAIEGLDCDNTAGGVIVLDIETLETANWSSPVPRRR